MKKKRVVSVIIVLAMLAFVVLYITKATNIGRQPSELEIEQLHSGNISARATRTLTLPVNASEANVASADTAPEQLRANNQLDLTTDSENITTLRTCLSLWLQDALAVNDTLRCVGDYANETKG